MREAVDNSRNRRIWRSLVEASSSANAWRRRNWKIGIGVYLLCTRIWYKLYSVYLITQAWHSYTVSDIIFYRCRFLDFPRFKYHWNWE